MSAGELLRTKFNCVLHCTARKCVPLLLGTNFNVRTAASSRKIVKEKNIGEISIIKIAAEAMA